MNFKCGRYFVFFVVITLPFMMSFLSWKDKKYNQDEVDVFILGLKGKYKPQVFEGAREPNDLPDLKKDKETLLGIDSNNDGVRDDLEIFINRHYKYDFERETLKETIRHLQKVYMQDIAKEKREKLEKVMGESLSPLNCLRLLEKKGIKALYSGPRYDEHYALSRIANTDKRNTFWDEYLKKIKSAKMAPNDDVNSYNVCTPYVKKKFSSIINKKND